MQRTNRWGWGGLSVLVFPDDAHSQLVRLRINYFILVFMGCLFVFLPLISIGVQAHTYWNRDEQVHEIEIRHRLLDISMGLTLEKKELIEKLQAQLNVFHQKFSSQKNHDLAELLPTHAVPSLDSEKTHQNKPGLHRSRYELEFLVPLREKMTAIIARQVPFIFRPIWHRMLIYHLTPKGWALLGGVGHVTSLYGNRKNPIESGDEFHSGIDFAYASGTPIIATAPGYVIRAVSVPKSGYGKFVRIHHGFGFTTLYAHCQAIAVEEGEYIERGQVIAYLGRTGRTTGDHLHYEIQLGLGRAVNPVPYVRLK